MRLAPTERFSEYPLRQFPGEFLVEDFADGEGDDDLVGLPEEAVDFGEGVLAVVEGDEEALGTVFATHHGFERVDVRAANFLLLLDLDRVPDVHEVELGLLCHLDLRRVGRFTPLSMSTVYRGLKVFSYAQSDRESLIPGLMILALSCLESFVLAMISDTPSCPLYADKALVATRYGALSSMRRSSHLA